MTTALGVSALGVRPLAGTSPRADPSVTITSPGATITSSTATLAFTYSSAVGLPQETYRYQVRNQDGSVVLKDSGIVVSSATSGISIDYLFSGGSEYQIWVQVYDGYDTSPWATQDVRCETSDVSGYTELETVGSVYEIAINGVGYMLDDDADTPVQRQVQQLNPPRLVTGDTPFSESFDRYSFTGQADWSGGAGQKHRDRPDSDPARFWTSEGMFPFDEDGGVRLGSSFYKTGTTHARPIMTAWASGYLMAGGDNKISSGGGAPITLASASTITDITAGGGHWYACDGANVFRNSTVADPGSAWSTINATLISWCIDRVGAVYDDGAGYVCVTTLDDAGAEEVAGGRFKYEDTNEIPSLVAGDGYLWFIVNDGYGDSRIMFWQVGSSDTYAANALELPPGEKAVELFFYLGNVFVRAQRSGQVVIYRCVPAEGRLTPFRVVEFDETETSTRGFAGSGRWVAFGWSNMVDGQPGVGLIDLTTGGWSTGPYLENDTYDGEVLVGLVMLYGQSAPAWVGVVTNGAGHIEVRSYEWAGGYQTAGQVDFSVSDLQSGLPKIFDKIELQFDPLPADTTISVEYTIDGGNSYTAAGTVDTDGQTSAVFDLEIRTRSLGLRVLMTGDGTTSPVLNIAQVKLHASSPTDEVIVLPVNCSDEFVGVNGYPIANELSGIERLRQLQALVGSRVLFQDVDWPVTGVASVWEVVGCEAGLYGYRSSQQNRRVESGRAIVTMRKDAS